MDAIVTGSGETQMADEDVCIAVGEDLHRNFPGYPWMVGVDTREHVGRVVIDLGIDKPPHLRNYAFALHVSSVIGPGGQKRVMRAGGELLERFGLRRGAAHPDTLDIALEHGLITDDNKDKSKH